MIKKKALFATVEGFALLVCCFWAYRVLYDSAVEIKSPFVAFSRRLHTNHTKHISQGKESFWKQYENKTIFILGADYNYVPLLLNHVLSLRGFGDYSFLVEAYDRKAYHFLRRVGFSVYRDVFSEKAAKHIFSTLDCGDGIGVFPKGDLQERRVMYIRMELYKAHLSMGLTSLSLDTDSCWLKSPDGILQDKTMNLMFVLQKGKTGIPGFSYNWVKGDDNFYRLNPGIAYLRPSVPFLELFTKMYGDSVSHLCDQGFAQAAVGRQLWDAGLRMSEVDGYLQGTAAGVRVKTLPYASYASACESEESKKVTKETLLVHANCQKVVPKKIHYLRRSNCWHLKDDWENLGKRRLSPHEYLDAIDTRKSQ